MEFDSAMMSVFQILMNVSRDFFNKSKSSFSAIDETEIEFMESICECMVTLASSNVQCITGDGAMISQFLQQVRPRAFLYYADDVQIVPFDILVEMSSNFAQCLINQIPEVSCVGNVKVGFLKYKILFIGFPIIFMK